MTQIEIGEPGTRAAGMVRYEGGDWQKADVYILTEMIRNLREEVEDLRNAGRGERRTIAVSGRH